MASWKLTWGDVSFGPDDLTVGDVAFVDGSTGCGWSGFDGLPSPRVAADLVAVVVSRISRRRLEEVAAEIAASPAALLVDALSVTSDDAAPATSADAR